MVKSRTGSGTPPAPSRIATLHNREAWLTEVGARIVPLFKGWEMGKFRVTCGWPSRGAIGKRLVLGQCFGADSSKGGVHEIFVSPLIDKSLDAAGTVCHEMAHVAAGIEAQHGPRFRKVCVAVGLTKGRPTTVMPGDKLNDCLRRHIADLGDYPHDAIVPTLRVVKPNTDVRLGCPECGCLVSMSAKWYGEVGAPTCRCGAEMVVRERKSRGRRKTDADI